MLEIVGRLVAKAYSDLDSAVGSWLGQRLQAEAVAEALGDGESRGAGLNSLLVEVQDNAAFVSGINIRQQARSRQECGSIVAVDELAEQRLPKDEDDAKERWRRYKKLELQARMLHAYCIKHRWPGSGGGGPGSPIPLNSERSRKRTKRATGKGQARTIVEADPMPQEAAMRLSEQMEEEVKVRAELGMEPVSFLDKVALGEVRRSRRVPGTDGADADSKEGAFQNGGSGSRKRTHSGREAPTNEELLLRCPPPPDPRGAVP